MMFLSIVSTSQESIQVHLLTNYELQENLGITIPLPEKAQSLWNVLLDKVGVSSE